MLHVPCCCVNNHLSHQDREVAITSEAHHVRASNPQELSDLNKKRADEATRTTSYSCSQNCS